MISVKKISISNHCCMCGLCEIEKYKNYILKTKDGKLKPLNDGILLNKKQIDLIQNLAQNCIVDAISFSDVIKSKTISEAYAEINDIINVKLRDYSFRTPQREEYEYVDKKYTNPPISCNYTTSSTYSNYDRAEEEGLKVFERQVYSQKDEIRNRLLVAYRVKQLKKFSHYEENEENYYYNENKKISNLIKKIEILIKSLSDENIKISESFSEFKVGPDISYDGDIYCYDLRNIENNYKLQKLCSYHEIVHYSTYVDVYDVGERYTYNFKEAEEELREDIDFEISIHATQIAEKVIESALNEYYIQARKLLNEKINYIQNKLKELRPYSSESNEQLFLNSMKKVQEEISKIDFKYILREKDLDTDYNSNYRFSSERECEKAASNRQWRCYEECLDFLSSGKNDNLANQLAVAYNKQIEDILTKIKRKIQIAYDLAGCEYPIKIVRLKNENMDIDIDLSNSENIRCYLVNNIKRYIESNSPSYDIPYSICDVNITYTCDYRESWFGEIKEINKKYAYDLSLWRYKYRLNEICEDWCKQFFHSDYLNKLKNDLKKQFIEQLNDLKKLNM